MEKENIFVLFLDTLHFFFFCFLGPHPWHTKVPRLGVKSELKLPAYTTATVAMDPSHIWDLHHRLWQRQIPNSLSKARDWIHILMDTSQICFLWATVGTPDPLYILL